MSKSKSVEIVEPRHTIAEHVEKDGPGAVTAADLKRFDRNIAANLGFEYMAWVQADMANLELALQRIEAGGETAGQATNDFRAIVHETRGLGGTFGYNLISAIGDQLYRMLDNVETPGPGQTTAIRLHLDAMKTVLAEGLKGDGGDRGQDVMVGLRDVFKKYSRRRS